MIYGPIVALIDIILVTIFNGMQKYFYSNRNRSRQTSSNRIQNYSKQKPNGQCNGNITIQKDIESMIDLLGNTSIHIGCIPVVIAIVTSKHLVQSKGLFAATASVTQKQQYPQQYSQQQLNITHPTEIKCIQPSFAYR